MPKERWTDPANVGQPDIMKIGKRVMTLIIILALAAAIRIGIQNQWFDSAREIFGF